MEFSIKTKVTTNQPEQSGGEEGDCLVSDIERGVRTSTRKSRRDEVDRKAMPPPTEPLPSTGKEQIYDDDDNVVLVERAGPACSKGKRIRVVKRDERSRSGGRRMPSSPSPVSMDTSEEPIPSTSRGTQDGEINRDVNLERFNLTASEINLVDRCIDRQAELDILTREEKRALSIDRGRGRPITSGEFTKYAEAKKEVQRVKQAELDLRVMEAATNSLIAAKNVVSGREMGEVPMAELACVVAEAIESIRHTAGISKGLKGTCKKTLHTAAAHITAVTDELSHRVEAQNSEDVNAGVIEELRVKLKRSEEETVCLRRETEALRGEMEATRREMEVLRRGLPPPSPSPVQRDTPLPQREKLQRGAKSAPKRIPSPGGVGEEEGTMMEWQGQVDPPELALRPPPVNAAPTAEPDCAVTPQQLKMALRANQEDTLLLIKALLDQRLGGAQKESAPPPSSSQREAPRPNPGVIQRMPVQRSGASSRPPPTGKSAKKKREDRRRDPTPRGAQKEKEAPLLVTVEPSTQERSWATVVRKGGKMGKGAPKKQGETPHPLPTKGANPPSQGGKKGDRGKAKQAPPPPPKRRRPPRSAAVTISCPPGGYEEVLSEAKTKIDLASLGIGGLRVKRTLTGALNYEVEEEGKEAKADALAAGLRDLFVNRPEIKVVRPTKSAELRVSGLDDVTNAEGVISAVAREGDCSPSLITANTVKRAPNGLGAVWVRCPLTAAIKIAKAGRLKVGWVWARAILLEERPLQCFKCLEGGHVKARCPNAADRSDRCYRCGATGHKAGMCKEAQPACPVCTDKGRPAKHRAGSKACPAAMGRQRGKRGVPTPTPAQTGGEQPPPPPPPSTMPTTESPVPPQGNPPSEMEVERESAKRPTTTTASSSDDEDTPGRGIDRSKRRKTENGVAPPFTVGDIGGEDATISQQTRGPDDSAGEC